MVDVQKRSGDTEKFDRNKIKTSVKKAGANDRQAETVTSNVEKKVRNRTNTSQIRDWVIIELRAVSDDLADNYQSHRKEMTPKQR